VVLMDFNYKNLHLSIPKGVYFPREDTLLLASVLEETDLKGKKVLEIGCGSGLLAMIAASKGAEVTTVDINPGAVSCTKENAKKNKLHMAVFESDLFCNVKGKFDLIFSNPPYLPVEKKETIDASYSAGPQGIEIIGKILISAYRYLKPKGKVLLLYSSLTKMEGILEGLSGCKIKILARKKIDFEELIVLEITFPENL